MSDGEYWRSLFVAPFDGLLKYFKQLRREDLVGLTEDEIVATVELEDRLLTRVFVKRHLAPFLESNTGRFDPRTARETHSPFVDESGCLHLERNVCSAALPYVPTGLTASAELPRTLLEAALTRSSKTVDDITSVNLAHCQLFDADVPHIDALVKKLPRWTELDVSGNRLAGRSGADKLLRQFIGGASHGAGDSASSSSVSPSSRVVNITGNQLATIDGKAFFKSLGDKELLNLIWIPESFLDTPPGEGWYTMLREGADRDTLASQVKDVHVKYYQQQRRRWALGR